MCPLSIHDRDVTLASEWIHGRLSIVFAVPLYSFKTLLNRCMNLSVVELKVRGVESPSNNQLVARASGSASVVNLTLDIGAGVESVIPVLFSTFSFPYLVDLHIGKFSVPIDSSTGAYLLPKLARFSLEMFSPAPVSVLESFSLPTLQQLPS
jgi:hypothetical protein